MAEYRVTGCNYKLSVCVILSVFTVANLSTFIAAIVLANKPIPTKMCPRYNAFVIKAQNHAQILQNGTKTGVVFTAMDYLVLNENNPQPLHNITDLETAKAYNLCELAKTQAAIFIYRNCNSVNVEARYYLEPIIMNYGSGWVPASVFLGMSLLFITSGFCIFLCFLKETHKQESVISTKEFSISGDV